MNYTTFDVFLNERLIATCYDWLTANMLAIGYEVQTSSNKVDVHPRKTDSNKFWQKGEPTEKGEYVIRYRGVVLCSLYTWDTEKRRFVGPLRHEIKCNELTGWHKIPEGEDR